SAVDNRRGIGVGVVQVVTDLRIGIDAAYEVPHVTAGRCHEVTARNGFIRAGTRMGVVGNLPRRCVVKAGGGLGAVRIAVGCRCASAVNVIGVGGRFVGAGRSSGL